MRGAATCTHTHTHTTHTAMMDDRSLAEGAKKVIYGSFFGYLSNARAHACSRSLSTVLVFFRNMLFCQHFFITPDGFHLWHFTSDKNLLHCLNANEKKAAESVQHTDSSQSRQEEAGSRRCAPTQTHCHTITNTLRRNTSDNISLLCKVTHTNTHTHTQTSSAMTRHLFVV